MGVGKFRSFTVILFSESPVDVPGHQTAEVPASPVVIAPVQEGQAVVEEIQQVRALSRF